MSRAVDVQVAGVEAPQVRRVVRPAERRERPERRREPRVEDVLVALELGRAALGARLRLGLGDGRRARRGSTRRELVTPPELPRDVPVRRVLERVDREAVLRLGVVAHAARRAARRSPAARARPSAPPLERDERLDAALAALADGDRVAVRLALLEQAALLAARRGSARRPPPASALRARRPRRSSARRGRSPSARAARGRGRSRSPSGRGPGVTLSAPVPKSGSTRSSAMTGTRRSTNGTITSLPTRSR